MESKTNGKVSVLKAHLALNVRDVGRSIDFYRRMLGIEPRKVRPGYAKFDVENPPLNLTLNENSFGERGALSHLGLQLSSTEDVLAVRERWATAGLHTRDEMRTNCCYAIQDKTWVADPDGNEWEAFVVLEDDLAETTMCCVAGEADAARTDASCAIAGAAPESAAVGAASVAGTAADSACCAPQDSAVAAGTGAASCCGADAAAAPLTISR